MMEDREMFIPLAKGQITGRKLIGHCKDCRHWKPTGECESENFIYGFMKETPVNGLIYEEESGGRGAFFRTGPLFGCIHWEAKE